MHDDLNYYLITDPKYYTHNPITFEKKLHKALDQNRVNIACFRDKTSSNYEQLAQIFVNVCQQHNIEHILLNENLALAKKLGCGIHLTSKQFDKIKEAKQNNMYVIISCHNILEIEKAQKAYVNAVTYSPIFPTPNKGEIKGLPNLKKILSIFDMNIIALGGIISQEHVSQIAKTKAYGFASIRYFLS
jgi:thiamine-phosphate pyrophosphorylase